ncbi:DUF695 domain-containing protein [Rhodoferax aquaticus]|uniref:DUF695 domain-containing protein n=1 Tax=Rhodoferax aquaticus TaxID=2527691 RepID=A0A515ETT3_9BURK|nr:DUF695 domain-containing protein [Rhodoferax aquaticus]QDL56028.1 DUF695 domain-containing protein [Rhodoferax aquaticus]
MQPTPEITHFWRDFAAAEASLQTLSLSERVERANALLEPHVQGLALEIMGKEGEAVVDLIVTAHGHIENFQRLTQLVAAAPKLAHNRVIAFRERSANPDFPIGMDGFELASHEVLVSLQQDNGQVALELRFAREIPYDFVDHARQMTFIMLDHVLGEFDFAVKVGAVDFVDEDFEQDQAWIALSQLPPVFDAYWAQTMGHTGHFPAGEHDWEGFDLQFNCAVDDEGNEVADSDLPEGEAGESEQGEVMVNTSANAVAMRADLAWALSLDFATPDDATRTAVQDLQAQAATLLQVPQLGIGVWTLQREGRRQALYYVSDEQLAKQALAPLLAREVAASLEMKVDFDPAWSGYFEYASYLL